MPFGAEANETQLPCSPSDLLKTDAAIATLQRVDTVDAMREAQAIENKAWGESAMVHRNIYVDYP